MNEENIRKQTAQLSNLPFIEKLLSCYLCKETLSNLDLNSGIEKYYDINNAYFGSIQKNTNIGLNKTKRVKCNSSEWLDDEVAESIVFRDKSFKKLKGSKLIVDKENYKNARYEVKKLIVKIKKQNGQKIMVNLERFEKLKNNMVCQKNQLFQKSSNLRKKIYHSMMQN